MGKWAEQKALYRAKRKKLGLRAEASDKGGFLWELQFPRDSADSCQMVLSS
jgi:hypothetical protein